MFHRILQSTVNLATASLEIGREAVNGTSITHFRSLDFSTKRNIVGRVVLIAFEAGLIAWLVRLKPLFIAVPAGIIAFAYYTNRNWTPSPFIEALPGMRAVLRIHEERRLERELENLRQNRHQRRPQMLLDAERNRPDLESMVEDPSLSAAERELARAALECHDTMMTEAVLQ